MTSNEWDNFLRELSRRTRIGLPLPPDVEADLDRRTMPFLDRDLLTVASGPLADQAAIELDRITRAYNEKRRGGWVRRILAWLGCSLSQSSANPKPTGSVKSNC